MDRYTINAIASGLWIGSAMLMMRLCMDRDSINSSMGYGCMMIVSGIIAHAYVRNGNKKEQ